MPERIQRKRTKGWRMPKNTLYVGRPSKYANWFIIGEIYYYFHRSGEIEKMIVRDRQHAVELFKRNYRGWIKQKDIDKLRGKNLACWCKIGDPCHADVLLELANE